MKRLILALVVFPLIANAAFSQDLIVKKDGTIIKSKVQEIGTSEVKYKKWPGKSGPQYSILISDILSIQYEDGEIEKFDNTTKANDVPNDNKVHYTKLSSNNSDLIDLYNKKCSITGEIKSNGKQAKSAYLLFGVSTNSELSHEDIEVSFVRKIEKHLQGTSKDRKNGYCDYVVNYIFITNKTNKVIYVDRANCFRSVDKSTLPVHVYYDQSKHLSVSENSGSGASLGLGAVANAVGVGGVVGKLASGVTIGGGSSATSTTSYGNERVIAIPPRTSRALSEQKQIEFGNDGYRYVDQAEKFLYLDSSELPISSNINTGQILEYDESNSPLKFNYTITYSTNQEFTETGTMNFSIYVMQVIGTHLWNRLLFKPTSDEEKESYGDKSFYQLSHLDKYLNLNEHNIIGAFFLKK